MAKAPTKIFAFPNTINITNIKVAGLANISDMALKVQYAVECDTNVPGVLRWENHGTIIKCNRREVQSRSKLRSNDHMIIQFCRYSTSMYLTTYRKIYQIDKLECERPPTNSTRKNQKKNTFLSHQRRKENPFHVDVLCHLAETYITDTGAVPE